MKVTNDQDQEVTKYGQYFEVDIDDVLRERFSSGQGVIQLQPGMTDEMILLVVKHAVALSDGKAFVVIPPPNTDKPAAGGVAFKHIAVQQDGSTHTLNFGYTAYGKGHAPAGGHKPVINPFAGSGTPTLAWS